MANSITKRRLPSSAKKATTRNLRHIRKAGKRGKRGKRTMSRRTRRAPRIFRRRQYRVSRRNRKMMRGGHDPDAATVSNNGAAFSLVPSTISDIGRSIQYGVTGAYSAVNGEDGPVNPLPYKDQLNNGQLPEDVMLLA